MSDESKLVNEQERGRKAELLLENPLLVDAFVEIESALVETWKRSRPEDGPMREDAWRSLRLLEKLRASFEGHVKTGKLASKELTDIRERRFGRRGH